MSCDSRFQVRRPALALSEAPKRNTEVFLGHGPEKRRPLAGKFFQCFAIGCDSRFQLRRPALAFPENVKRSAEIALGLGRSIERRQGGPTDRIAYATGRGVAAGLNESRCSRGKRNVEGEDMVCAGLNALRGSIHLQLELRQIGIHAYRGAAAGTGIVAPLGDVDSRLARPIRLIPVKCILARQAIVRHESLVVAARRVAFIATVAGEVEHVPNELTPQVSAGFHRLPVRLVEERLPLLRMKRATWVGLRRR